MTIEVHAVQSIKAFVESTFGADSSASSASFTFIPLREGSAKVELTRESYDPQQLVSHIDEYRKEVLGKRSAKLTFTCNLAATGTAAGASTAAVQGGLGMLLKDMLGGETLGTGTTFTGGTATVPTVTSAAGFAVGGCIGWVNSSGVLEVREIKSISGTSITLKLAFSGSPSNGNTAYAGATYYPTANPANSFAFIIEGLESDDKWLLTGGQLVDGMTINLDPSAGGIPSITFSMQFARWYDSTETASSLTGTIETATYSNFQPIVGEAGDVRVQTVGAPTLVTTTQVQVNAIQFAPQIGYVPYRSPSGTNTIKRWVRARKAPTITGGWTDIYQDTTWWAARNNRTDKALTYQFGTAAGSTVMLSATTIQIMTPQRVDAGGLSGNSVTFKGRRDTGTSGSTSDQALAPFRIHLV